MPDADTNARAAARGHGRKVLIIVENLPVPFDRRVWQEASVLVAEGYTVSIICPKGRGYEESYQFLDGVHIHRHSLPLEARSAKAYLIEYPVALFWEFVLAWKVLLTRGFDVIHACNPPDDIFVVAWFFKIFFGKKFLFDHHDLCPEFFIAKFKRQGFPYRMLRLAERLTYRCADVSIATNASYRKVAIERGGMDPDKVFIVRSGPSLERMRILPPVEALKYGRRYLVGYLGVMSQAEGIPYLLGAMKYIIEELGRTDIHCTLVGGGPEMNELRALAEREGVSDYVNFTGRVPDQQLLEVLNTADVCVNPDEVNEMNDKSTMNKIMEYMSLGKPIVQFDVTEGRFSAQDASLYAKPNDAIDFAQKIIELIESPERRAEMGRFGRARVENELAWRYEVPKLIAAYDAVFAGR